MAFATYPSLRDRTVFITGGASGIGEALVEAFRGQGAHVAFVDNNQVAGEALVRRIPDVMFQYADVTNSSSLEAAISAASAALGPITVLINNVANDTRHEAMTMTAADWRANLAVNLDPVFIAATAVVPGMARAGGGTIINLGSINSILTPGGMPAYVAAKGAVSALTGALAQDWGGMGVRVNCISPGWVVTERQLALWLTEDAEAAHMAQVALKARIMPADVARLALFLAADDSAMITGQDIVIDGGRT